MRERLELEEAIALVEAETTRRQQEALHPKTDSAAPVPDKPPPRQGSVPPVEKAAASAPRKQPLNLAPSQQRHEAQIEQPSASSHDGRPATLSADQHSQNLSETQHAPADADAGPRLSVLLQSMLDAAPAPRQREAPHSNPGSAARVPDAPPAKQGGIPPLKTAASAAPPKQSSPPSNAVSAARVSDAPPAKQGSTPPLETATSATPPN